MTDYQYHHLLNCIAIMTAALDIAVGLCTALIVVEIGKLLTPSPQQKGKSKWIK